MILEPRPSSARTAATQPVAPPTTAELEQELRALRRRLDELADEVRSRRAPAARRRAGRRWRGALEQGSRELRAQHEEKALEQLRRAGLNRLI